MINNIQNDYVLFRISFDGCDFLTIEVPRTEYSKFIDAWYAGCKYVIKQVNRAGTITKMTHLDLSKVVFIEEV